MIRSLRGIVTSTGEQHVVVEVQNVGYVVGTNTTRAGLATGDSVLLHTYLAVRENALDLYGFTEKDELELFMLLLTIPKIGPKSALQILCQADPATIVAAVEKGDGTYLHKMSGIGKKTADAIVTHLKEKIHASFTATNTSEVASSAHNDVIDALIALGYTASEARESVRALGEGLDTKELITKALRQLTTK